MPGKRNNVLADYVTNWVRVRTNVSAADSASVSDAGIPEFSTQGGPNDAMFGSTVKTDGNFYGRNAQISLAAIISGFSSITLQLWLLVEESTIPVPEPIGSSASESALTEPTSGMWVLVGTSPALLKSGLWVVKDIPPGKFKVVISASAGSGAVSILESHAA